MLRRPEWLRRPWTADAALALAVVAVEIAGAVLNADEQPLAKPLDALGYALIVVSAGALLIRRRYPNLVLLTTILPMAAYYPLGYPEGPVYLAVLIAIYTAAAFGRRLQAIAAAVLTFLFTLVGGYLLISDKQVSVQTLAWAGGTAVAVLIGGEVSRNRRAYLAEARERAAQAERIWEEEARRSADEERLRIARELHDVLAHNISMMNVQAGVAAHLLDERPEQARSALLAIKDASKDALRELRATLGVLRQADDVSSREPTPGLARMPELVDRATSAGLRVDVHTEGVQGQLPDGVDLAAYRILQEALTNATRHANARTAAVRVTYGQRELRIQVDDDGIGVPDGAATGEDGMAVTGGGNGIVGMRERAAALGGTLDAGPGPECGFRVLARLPLEPRKNAVGGAR